MAYQFTDYSGYGNETEEETRKRRAMMMAGLPEGAGLGDIASQAIQNRVGQAQQTINNAGQMFSNVMQPQAPGPDDEVKKQTIKTYGDGSTEHTVTTQVPAPVAPETQMPQATMPAPAPAPVAPVNPVAQAPIQANTPMPNIGQPPTPGPGIQVAGPAQMPPQQVAPVNPQAQAPAPAPSGFTPTVERETEPLTMEQQHHQAVIDAGNEQDPSKRRSMFAQLLANKDVNEGTKTLANRLIAEDYLKQRNIDKANEELQNATPNDLSRYMRENKSEGSYIKAILLQRLGLTDLAQKEMELISPTKTMSSAVDEDGNKYTVYRNKDGEIIKGFDASGKSVGQEALAKLSAAALPTQAHLLPGVHGGLMQKTVTGPDGKPVQITGVVKSDPRTNQTYFESGNKRYDTSGLTTPAQNIEQKFLGAQAGEQGKAAGQGLQVPSSQAAPTQPENAVQMATRLGLPIISGVRDEAKQQQLYDESVRAGRTGFTASGNPIAKPGTSQHQNANAVDMKLTPEQAKIAEQNGFYRPLANDPNHWELRPATGNKVPSIPAQKAAIETQAAANKERATTAAKTIDEKLNNLNTIQDQAQRGLDALENNQHLFGGGSNAVARANNRLNPLKTQSDEYRNTADIMQLAQRENLTNLASLLKGSFSDKDLAYINKNMINENSSPAQVKKWLEHYVAASRRAYEQQATSVNQANAPSPNAPAAPTTPAKVRRYNPTTGKLE
jgi:hypothetical protein